MILSDALILPPSQLQTEHIRHSIFNTYLLYYCAHFVVEIDEQSSLNIGL